MRTIYTNCIKSLAALTMGAMTALLTSCGGSGVTTGTTPPGTTPGQPSITISALTDPSTGLVTTSTPAIARATVLDGDGAPVPNVVVTFSVNTAVATLSPSTGTALTNSSGVATIGLTAADSTAGGASTLIASSSVSGTTVSTSIGFSVNASTPVAGVTFTSLTFGSGASLSAYGTTSVTATVTPATSPVTVTFSSPCASNGKATLTSSVTTVGGIATGSYQDNGCATTDTITASIGGTTASISAPLVVTPPTTGSLQFVSALPASISLRGTGGTESSVVTFKVLDSGSQPMSGKVVTFGLSTTLGGITFTPNVAAPTATSDAAGLVSIIVNAGTMSTPVRVTASTPGATAGSVLNTQSNTLTITTGIPDQDSFSLAGSTINIEGLNIDGVTSTLTVRLSDHFNNPVPDGTPINLTTEGGSVVGSCITANGVCTTLFTTQQPRPANGRVTVLAFAVGEESFTDLNGSGVADLAPTNEMIDANANSTDMAEAFVDYNENGIFDGATEWYADFNGNGVYDTADGQYSGVLCDNIATSSPGTCSATRSIHVRRSLLLTMSSSSPAPLAVFDDSAPPVQVASAVLSLPACDATGGFAPMDAVTYYIRIVDVNGNAMPTGTTMTFATSNGTLLSPASAGPTPNEIGCSSYFTGCPASAASPVFGFYPVILKSDATLNATTGVCTNASTSGILTVKVTSPGGLITTTLFDVVD